LADLAVLCANCHRMIHKTRPLMPVEEFRRLVAPAAASTCGSSICGGFPRARC
jgi:hypothetical protein